MNLAKRTFLFIAATSIVLFAGPAKSQTSAQIFYVKGMHCMGCVDGLTEVLEKNQFKKYLKNPKDITYQSPDPKNTIGQMKLYLPQDLKNKEFYCRLSAAIEKELGQIIFWDAKQLETPKNIQNPCAKK